MTPNIVVTATSAEDPTALAQQILPVVNEVRFAVAAPGLDLNAEQMERLLVALQDATTAALSEQLDLVAREAAHAEEAALAAAWAETAAAEAAAQDNEVVT